MVAFAVFCLQLACMTGTPLVQHCAVRPGKTVMDIMFMPLHSMFGVANCQASR